MKNWKSWWLVAISAFLICWLGDWASATWLADDEMLSMWGLENRSWFSLETILAYAWFALALTFIFIKGYEGRSWREGVRFGTYMWALTLGTLWISNLMPSKDWLFWAAAMWVGFAFVGWVMWCTYKPKSIA